MEEKDAQPVLRFTTCVKVRGSNFLHFMGPIFSLSPFTFLAHS